MLEAPRDMWGLNAFQLLVDHLGEGEAAKSLGVSKRTFADWLHGRRAVPRCAVLALYWDSPFGRSLIDTDHHNEIKLLGAMISTLRDENTALRAQMRSLEAGRHWSANDTYFEPGGLGYIMPGRAGAADATRRPGSGDPIHRDGQASGLRWGWRLSRKMRRRRPHAR